MTRRKKVGLGLALGLAALVAVYCVGVPTEGDEHWRAFGEQWFTDHQPQLLRALNDPWTARVTRWTLCIHPDDCPRSERIVAIGPNRFSYGERRLANGATQQTTDFRTHPKFSKRVYFSLRPFWWLAHAWDKVADRWAPEQSFGLSTLTAFPDAGSGTTTCDASFSATATNAAFTTLTAASGTSVDVSGALPAGWQWTCGSTTNNFNRIDRFGMTFDTSAIGGGQTISAAVLSVGGQSKAVDINGRAPTTDIYNFSPASNTSFAASDYANCGSTSQTGSPVAYASLTTNSSYVAFTLNSTGRSNVSTSGVSKFCMRCANYDAANTAPGWTSSQFLRWLVNTADAAGTSSDPKLVVTYSATPPSGFDALLLGGN